MNSPAKNMETPAVNLVCAPRTGAKFVARQSRIVGFLSHARQAAVLALACVALSSFAQVKPWQNMGRDATPAEVKAWDIDVRPDFKGLPKGQGTVAKGMEVWESKCESCHGIFGESNSVFAPITGGTAADDIKTGRVERLTDPSFPGRTTMMKLSSVSTLWDYINRAMPWTAPKSLTTEEVYAVTAYVLNLGGVLPNDFTLSNENIGEVQKRIPNRNGMTTDHAMWPGAQTGKRKPDVLAAACMKDCSETPTLASFLPDFARNAHGNLAEQNRAVGAQHGADTTQPPASAAQAAAAKVDIATAAPPATPSVAAAPAAPPKASADGAATAIALTKKHGCVACHGMDGKILGPSFRDIAKRYAGTADATTKLVTKIKAGGSGAWGAIPMPPQTLGEPDAKAIAQWLANGLK